MKLILEPASNGYVKTIVEENANGNDAVFTQTLVYEFPEDDMFEKDNQNTLIKSSQLIFDILDDLSISTGNKHSIYKMSFFIEKNDEFLTEDDINEKIEYYQEQLKKYTQMKG